MLEKLVDLVISFIRIFQVAAIIRTYEGAIVLRFGRLHRELKPGFHWLWPFRVEEVLAATTVMETINTEPQSLTTKDDVGIVVSAVVTFQIKDVSQFLLSVMEARNVLEDSTYGVIAQAVEDADWQDIRKASFSSGIQKDIRRMAKPWGIDIIRVCLSDKTRSRSFRLLNHKPGNSTGLYG